MTRLYRRLSLGLPHLVLPLLVGCMMVSAGPLLMAQTIYGSISGTVLDQTGAALPGAEITVKNLETGLARQTITSEVGFYRIPALPSGQYSVQAGMPSFETILRQPITVAVSRDVTVDFTLKAAAVQEVVTVTSQAPLIETTRSQLSKLADSLQILNLPGRNNLTGLALLQPGTAPNNNGRPGSGFVVNGGRTRSNNFTIDGANNNDQSLSIPRTTLPPEAIQEFQLITNNFSAEYGRNSGSYVNVITRSGTNDFHGGVLWTWLGNSLDALSTGQERTYKNALTTPGITEKQALRRARGVVVENQGGLMVGGPVKKDHTFFFTSYDRDWYRTTAVPAPTIAVSSQGMANLEAAKGQFAPGALDFLKSTFPLANDTTSRGQINLTTPTGTIAVPLQQFNRALTGSFPYARGYWRYMQKLDTRLTESDNLSGRYLIYQYNDPGAPTALPRHELGQTQRDQSLTLNEVHIFGPRTTNEFRVTYSRRNIQFPENFPPVLTITGFNGVGNQNFPQFRTDNMFEYTDNLTHTMTRHTLKGGANVLRYQLNSFFAPDSRGSVIYPSLGDFLFDRNATFTQYAGTGYVPARTTEAGMFFQDDWRATQALTLNMGIRWEYTGTPFGLFSEAKPDLNNWCPRFGFAVRPTGMGWLFDGKTVIRGGYAISYDQVFQNILLNVSRNFPRGVSVVRSPITGQRLYDPANRPTPPTPEDYVKQGNDPKLLPVRLFSPGQRVTQPYSQQFSLGIERQFFTDFAFRAYYVGSRGVHLVREVESNIGFDARAVSANPSVYAGILSSLQPVRNAAGQIVSYKTDPTRGSVLVADGRASSIYHSLQITVDKRFSRGLQFQANYTWSSFINDSDDILGGTANRTLPAYPFNISLDRARSAFDQPHRFVLNYIYLSPNVLRDNGVLNRILSGWQLSGITTFASGTPFSILNSANALGILAGQITTVHLSQRVSINSSGTYPQPTSAGVTSPYYVYNDTNTGIIGNAGANIERTGGTIGFDVALAKNIKTIGENQALQFRWEVFNAIMHRNFTTIPTNTVTRTTNTALFLNLGQTNVGGRTMLFTLRYTF